MNLKKIILFSAIFLVAAGCQKKAEPVKTEVFTQEKIALVSDTPATSTPTNIPTSTPVATPTPPINNSKVVYLEWIFKKLPDGAYETPYDQIALKLSGAVEKTMDLGKLSGCRITQNFYAPEEKIPDAQVAYLFCWWAGAGDILTVNFEKPDQLTIFRQEMGEDPEGTNYKPYKIKTIKIPRDLAIEFKEEE